MENSAWVTTKHPVQCHRRKPFLIEVEQLSREFQEAFLAGLRQLICTEKLRLEKEFARLQEHKAREVWLKELQSTAWNVFVQGPPHGQSDPIHVVKYLARYMTGGPISDRRLICNAEEKVTFWARTKDGKNQSEPFTLRGTEFVRRWSMHVLPKGYTRSRSYGGYHGSKRADYLSRCRELLKIDADLDDPSHEGPLEQYVPNLPKCVHCNLEMACIEATPRPSWREIFTQAVYRLRLYCPLLHLSFGLPEAHAIGGYG